MYLVMVFFPNFPRFLPNSSHFATFGKVKPKIFRRFAPILVIITLKFSPARAENSGRKQVSSTVGVGKETGSVARILMGASYISEHVMLFNSSSWSGSSACLYSSYAIVLDSLMCFRDFSNKKILYEKITCGVDKFLKFWVGLPTYCGVEATK